jgi:hypothetical protein
MSHDLGLGRELRFWLIGFAVFFAALYLLSGILLPFVAGMAIAYLLDPICDWLEGRGLSRTLATTALTLVFLVLVGSWWPAACSCSCRWSPGSWPVSPRARRPISRRCAARSSSCSS